MSMRACWTDAQHVEIEITTDFRDQYGSEVDTIAIGLFQDQDGLVVEGGDLADLRGFVNRLNEALDAYEAEHRDE